MEEKLERLKAKLAKTYALNRLKQNRRAQKKVEKLETKIWWENIEYDITPEEQEFRKRSKGNPYYKD